jgi:hypothetical protein
MSLKDIRLGQLSRIYIDGIPLDLASGLLPSKSKLRIPLLLHLHLHAKSQKRYANRSVNTKNRKVSRQFSVLSIHLNPQSHVSPGNPGGQSGPTIIRTPTTRRPALSTNRNSSANI